MHKSIIENDNSQEIEYQNDYELEEMKFGISQCGVYDKGGSNDYDNLTSSIQTVMANYKDPKIREEEFKTEDE